MKKNIDEAAPKCKKKHRITTRFDEEEYNNICKYSKQLRLKKSSYIRRCVLSKKPIYTLREDEREWVKKLVGQSNNINQITRLAQLNGLTSVLIEILEMRKGIDYVIKKLQP